MTDGDPEPNNPLAPYYPSETPDVPGSGRTWFAVLVALLFLVHVVYVLGLLVPP